MGIWRRKKHGSSWGRMSSRYGPEGKRGRRNAERAFTRDIGQSMERMIAGQTQRGA